MRRHRSDLNTAPISKKAEELGFRVYKCNNSLCDLVVQLRDKTELWEVKSATGDFTPNQKTMRSEGWQIRTIRSVDDVLLARNEITFGRANG